MVFPFSRNGPANYNFSLFSKLSTNYPKTSEKIRFKHRKIPRSGIFTYVFCISFLKPMSSRYLPGLSLGRWGGASLWMWAYVGLMFAFQDSSAWSKSMNRAWTWWVKLKQASRPNLHEAHMSKYSKSPLQSGRQERGHTLNFSSPWGVRGVLYQPLVSV